MSQEPGETTSSYRSVQGFLRVMSVTLGVNMAIILAYAFFGKWLNRDFPISLIVALMIVQVVAAATSVVAYVRNRRLDKETERDYRAYRSELNAGLIRDGVLARSLPVSLAGRSPSETRQKTS